MAYLPKSKYHIETSRGDYSFQDGTPYYGPIVVTYNDRVYPGDHFTDGLERLYLTEEPGETLVVTGSVAKKRYPTDQERSQGYMDRYFQQDLRTKKIVEISPSDYSGSRSQVTTSPYKVFSYATASWCLGGRPVEDQELVVGSGRQRYTREGIRTYNSRSIADLEKVFPGVSSSGVLWNPLEFIEVSQEGN